MQIETRHLRYFLAVAEELHVGRAAKRLHMSQPPLSRQIQQLEQRVGAALFDREGRRMSLTSAGRVFRDEAQRALDSLSRAADHARRVGRGARGIVRVGFVSTLLYGLLPSLVRDFRAAHADIELDLEELTADAQLLALAEGRIDAGFQLCPEPAPDIEPIHLFEEPLILCLPEAHAQARRRTPVPVTALREERFVMFPRHLSTGLHDRILGVAAQAGFSMQVRQQAVQMQTIVGLVSAGMGIAIVPACMRALARPGVVYKKLTPAPPRIETALVRPTARTRPAADAFVNFAAALAYPRGAAGRTRR